MINWNPIHYVLKKKKSKFFQKTILFKKSIEIQFEGTNQSLHNNSY